MKKSICQGSFPKDLSTKQCIKIASEAGFDAIQLVLEDPSSVNEDLINRDARVKRIAESVGMEKAREGSISPDSSPEELAELEKALETYDMNVSSVMTMLHWFFPFTSPESNIASNAIEIGETMIDYADRFDADTVLIIPGVVTEEVSYSDAYGRAKETIGQLVPYGEEKGVSLGIENVWSKFLLSPLEMKRFVEEFDSPQAGVYFDVGNILDYGFPSHWIELLGDKIKKIHLKDYNRSLGGISGFTYLLQGNVNWPRVVKSLEEIDYEDYLTVEVPPYPSFAPERAVFDSSRSLDKILSLGNN